MVGAASLLQRFSSCSSPLLGPFAAATSVSQLPGGWGARTRKLERENGGVSLAFHAFLFSGLQAQLEGYAGLSVCTTVLKPDFQSASSSDWEYARKNGKLTASLLVF